jgi:hypothetical protein
LLAGSIVIATGVIVATGAGGAGTAARAACRGEHRDFERDNSGEQHKL